MTKRGIIMKGSIPVLVLLFLPLTAIAQVPDWVTNQGKNARYNGLTYLTGFGMAKPGKDKNRAECLQRATESARSSLIQTIRVTIQSTVTHLQQETDTKYSSYFSTATQATSNLEVQGLETQTYYHDRERMGYALAYVSREKLISIYDQKAADLRQAIRSHLESGRRYEATGKHTDALDAYLACYPLFRQLEETQAIITAAQSRMTSAFAELDALDKTVTNDEVSIAQVREAVDRLVQRPINSPDDLAWYLAYCLKNQVDSAGLVALVTPFTYQDTKMGSPFSRFFKQVLEQKVVEVARWRVVQQASNVQPRTRDVAREFAEASGAAYVLTGTYWEQPAGVKFLAILRRVSDSAVMASAEAVAGSDVVQRAQLSLKPENFQQALSDQKVFNKDEVIGGGLSLEVWTNKGSESLLFTEGERMQVYVRVNIPCYIRLIDHLANGQRVLLLDNYYIDESKVNLVYQIPQEFECAAPFGVETLHAFARLEKFELVETINMDGYDILREDLQAFVGRTRGFKKVKPDVLQAETRVVMTTMGRD